MAINRTTEVYPNLSIIKEQKNNKTLSKITCSMYHAYPKSTCYILGDALTQAASILKNRRGSFQGYILSFQKMATSLINTGL